MNLSIKMVGDKEAAQAFAKLDGNLSGKKLEAAVVSGAWILLNRMKELAPKLTRTLEWSLHIGGDPMFAGGEGYSDIGGRVVTPDYVKVEVGTNLIYAPIQEFGGTIRAKNKPYLVFQTKDGSWHSVKSVQIPPVGYMRGAYAEKKDAVIREVDEAVDDMIRDAFK